MDDLDRRILALLKEDGRMSFVDIAKELGVPRPTVYLRVKNMKENGAIKNFTVILGGDKTQSAFLKIKDFLISKMSERVIERAVDKLSHIPGVIVVSKTSSDTIFVVWKGDVFNPSKLDNVLSVERAEVLFHGL